jgi:hypothetical protein
MDLMLRLYANPFEDRMSGPVQYVEISKKPVICLYD